MINKEKTTELRIIVIATLLTVVFGFFMIKASITGFVVFEGYDVYTDNIGVNVSSDMLYTWIPDQRGSLTSLGISGYLEGDSAEVYLFDNLVYSSPKLNKTAVTIKDGSGEILLEFTYGDESGYDNNNDGINYKEGVIDFSINAEFNFDVNKPLKDNKTKKKVKKKDDIYLKLCTKYIVNSLDDDLSQAVCYGNSECCSFLNLESSNDKWNDSFYLNYGKYGAGYNNSVLAQIVYYDVSLNESDLHSYIYNSEVKKLYANFVDRIYFDLTCVDTCSLPFYLNESYDLDISVDGLLHISDVIYTVVDDDTLVNITNETVINETLVNETLINVTEVNVTFVNVTNETLINKTLVNETNETTIQTISIQERTISGAGDSSNVPQTISLNGKLTNSSDDPLNGTYNMSFKIYDSPTNGNLLWEVVNQTITVDSNGIYHFTLTNVNLTFSDSTYLGIQVENDSEMIPRINLTSTPYTFRATIADSLNSLNNYQIQNLTLGEIINFSSGETIDNLVDGFIRVSGSLNITGNITSNYYIGSGSLLTDVCLANGTNCQAANDTQKNTTGFYLYNDSTTIYFNETQLNLTIDDRDDTIGNCSGSGSCSSIVYDGDANVTLIVYQNITNLPTCGGTDKLTFNGTTLSCDTDQTGGGSYDLNISSDSGTGVILDSEIFNLTGSGTVNTSISGNILTITGSAHTVDTNETDRVSEIVATNCTGQVVAGFFANGTGFCEEDDTGGGGTGKT